MSIKPIEIFTALDLEMAQPSQKIIMLGACIGSIKTGEILETLRCYVKIDEPLTPFITELTNITDHDLDTKGITLLEAYLKLKESHLKYGSHASVVQWGQGDERKLKEDLLQYGMPKEEWVFGYRHFDVKTLYQSYCLSNEIKLQSGLAKSMTKLGLRFIGTKHDGCDDAINTFRIFHELLKRIKY